MFIDGDVDAGRERIRAHIQDLQRRQMALIGSFPGIAPTFAALSHSLADAYRNPTRDNLAALRRQLDESRHQLQELAAESTRRQRELADDYFIRGDRAARNTLLLGLAGMLAIGAVAMFFFAGMTRDIKRLEARVDDVVHGYRGTPLPVTRGDELGQLTADVNRMVSELAESEARLDFERRKSFQQEKMASIGTLAAGIVHEIGNPVAAISGLVNALRNESPPPRATDDAPQDKLLMIHEQVDRLAAIARDVSDFAVPQSSARQLLDLNGLISNTNRFMRFDRRLRNIDIRLELDAALPAVYGVSDQLTQLLMNLMINAADAMEEHAVETALIRIATRREADDVEMVIEDNGSGMDSTTLERALDPFFTTKGAGRGTGLGLPLCYSIVAAHGGSLGLDSQPGEGSRVTVRLPIDERTRHRAQDAGPAAGERAS
jgi:signal transduction histidine kinase